MIRMQSRARATAAIVFAVALGRDGDSSGDTTTGHPSAVSAASVSEPHFGGTYDTSPSCSVNESTTRSPSTSYTGITGA